MTYSSGGQISATDYNTLAFTNPSIGGQWGTGTGDAGLGQSTAAIATVAAASTVTATQWTGLIQTINSCLAHEGQTNITPASVTAGNLITYYDAIATGSALAYNQRGTAAAALTASAASVSSTTSAWTSLNLVHSVTFASADAARYFFNAGGTITLTRSRTGGTANAVNTAWTNLCAATATTTFGYKNTTKVGGTGTPNVLLNANNGGYWNNTTSDLMHYRQYDTAATYTSHYLAVQARWSGTPANGGYPVLVITVGFNSTDVVDGTTSSSLVVNSPNTAYITNTWGTPVLTHTP